MTDKTQDQDDEIVWPFVFPLKKALAAHGEELKALTLREPTGEDLMETGYPYLIVTGDSGSEGVELRPKIIGKWVSKLAGIPPSSVKKIGFADLQGLQGVIMGFFGQGQKEEKSTTSKTESST